jgi:Flp pilus assembly protein CpaB
VAETQAQGRPRRAYRLSRAALAAVLLVMVLGVSYLTIFPHTTTVYVAAADLPAYWPIEQRDVRRLTVDTRSAPDDAITDRNSLVGRYTMESTEQDEPFERSGVGPAVPPDALRQTVLVALPGGPEVHLGGRLAPGDRVDVALSAVNVSVQGSVLEDVLVVDVRTSPPSVVLALDVKEQSLLSALAGTTRPMVMRRPNVP